MSHIPVKLNSWMESLGVYALYRNDERKKRLAASGRAIFDCGIGDPQEETPAFLREALARAIPVISQYPSMTGGMPLREACARWVKRRFDVELDPARQVISSNGSKEAVFHLPHLLCNAASQRRIIVMPDPGYPVYRSGTLLAGAVPYEVPLLPEHGFVFQPEQIPAEILPQVAAVWVNYPHNPTGAVISFEQMRRIRDWALKWDVVLISDECYVDMFFPGESPPRSFLELGSADGFKNLLALFSLSKRSGMTGYRSGFVAGDEALVKAFGQYRGHAGLGTPEFVQAAARAAWEEPQHVIERNRIFQGKRKPVDAFLERNKFSYLKSGATFYVWIQVPPGSPGDGLAEAYCERLAERTGIIATPGDALGRSCADWFRLALVPTAERLQEALGLWQDAIDKGAFRP